MGLVTASWEFAPFSDQPWQGFAGALVSSIAAALIAFGIWWLSRRDVEAVARERDAHDAAKLLTRRWNELFDVLTHAAISGTHELVPAAIRSWMTVTITEAPALGDDLAKLLTRATQNLYAWQTNASARLTTPPTDGVVSPPAEAAVHELGRYFSEVTIALGARRLNKRIPEVADIRWPD